MNAATFTLDNVPDTLGARDRMVALARQQNASNAEHEATVAQRREWIRGDLEKLLSAGNLEAPCFFLPRKAGVRAQKVWEILAEMAEYDDFAKRLVTLLFFASEGCDVTHYAQELRELMVAKVAELEADQ